MIRDNNWLYTFYLLFAQRFAVHAKCLKNREEFKGMGKELRENKRNKSESEIIRSLHLANFYFVLWPGILEVNGFLKRVKMIFMFLMVLWALQGFLRLYNDL